MAENFVNKTGLQYYHNRAKTIFASQTDFDALDEKVDGIISEGGEPNVIETVKVNGTALTPDSSKAVNVTVPKKTSDLENDGDGDSNFATEGYVDQNGGKIDVIKVNGTAQTITNKTVDITVPTKTSELTNDSDFQDETEVQALIDAALEDITGIEFEVVTELPASGVKGTIYLVHKDGTTGDLYDEYVWVTPASGSAHFEKIGTTDIDLSDYWGKSELTAITTAEIDTLFA